MLLIFQNQKNRKYNLCFFSISRFYKEVTFYNSFDTLRIKKTGKRK